jgi:hypothetical protein
VSVRYEEEEEEECMRTKQYQEENERRNAAFRECTNIDGKGKIVCMLN